MCCMEVAPCTHREGACGHPHTSRTAVVSFWDQKYGDWQKWDASVPDVLYTFLVTTITCFTSERQPWLDGGILSRVPCQHKMTRGGDAKDLQQFTVTLNMRKEEIVTIKSNETRSVLA